jgi:hypothetical protein
LNFDFGEPTPVRRTRREKIQDFFTSKLGILSLIATITIPLIFGLLPYLGISPPQSQIPEKTFPPLIELDFRNKDGTYSNRVIDLNHPTIIENSFKLKGLVPHEGTISVFIENYTLFGEYDPKVFEIKDSSTYVKENFPVGKGEFEREIILKLYPQIRYTDTNYLMMPPGGSECTAGFIRVFYKVEYFDVIDNEKKILFVSQPFDGRWDVKGNQTCYPGQRQ